MKLTNLRPMVNTLPSMRTPVVCNDSWRMGKTTAERGYGSRWQTARATYLASHPLCVMCQRNGRVTAATVVDHVQPHRGEQARFWDVHNWQALCAHHHSSHKQAQEAAA